MPAALDIYVESLATFRTSRTYAILELIDQVKRAGVAVRILDRPLRRSQAESAFLHIDLTELPLRFREIRDIYPRTVNGSAFSIHRHLYSTLRLKEDDGYDGPAIVKTVLNSYGRPELRFRQHRNIWTRTSHALHKVLDPGFKRRLAPHYSVYASARDIPTEVWRDERLIVEKFAFPSLDLPIVKHRYIFFGDVELNLRQSFDDLLCAGSKLLTNESVALPAPEPVMQVRRRLSLDYGSIDYFIVDGSAVVVDANRTYGSNPDWSRRYPFRREYTEQVAKRLIRFAEGEAI